MPRTTKKAVLARRQKRDEPFLFDYDSLPVREDLVECVRQERYKHTGARLRDDEELTQRVVNRLCLRHGIERIARDEHISPMSIRAAREVLVSQGKMGGFVKRFQQRAEEIIEAGMEAFYQGILSGEVSPGQLPVGLGIIFDKRALSLGEPTSIGLSANANLRPEALSERAINAWVESLPVESESIVICENHKQLTQCPHPDAALVAESTTPIAAVVATEAIGVTTASDMAAAVEASPPAVQDGPPEIGGGGCGSG